MSELIKGQRVGLESWYRRLIALYPPGHRLVYAEDLMNVLMDSAVPDQKRPDLSTGVDLLKGAAAAWVLRLRSKGRALPKGSAAIALIALLMLCIQSITAAGRAMDDMTASSNGRWGELVLGLPDLVWLPIAVAAAIGLRRPGAWVAWGVGLIWPLLSQVGGVGEAVPDYLGSLDSPLWVPVALIAAAGLLVDGGTRQGFQELGRTGTRAAIIGALMIGLATTTLPVVADAVAARPSLLGLPLLGIGLALVILACIRPLTRTNRGWAQATAVAVVIQVLVFGVFAWQDAGNAYSDLQEQVDTTLPLILLACTLIVGRSMLKMRDWQRQPATAVGAAARGLAAVRRRQ
jgi:hypothetical protein